MCYIPITVSRRPASAHTPSCQALPSLASANPVYLLPMQCMHQCPSAAAGGRWQCAMLTQQEPALLRCCECSVRRTNLRCRFATCMSSQMLALVSRRSNKLVSRSLRAGFPQQYATKLSWHQLLRTVSSGRAWVKQNCVTLDGSPCGSSMAWVALEQRSRVAASARNLAF